mgnify:CR=1 FL=1
MGLVGLQLIREEFQEDPKNDQMVFAVYKTVPTPSLVQVVAVRTTDLTHKEFHEFDNNRFNGVPVITIRVSNAEYEYYLRLVP